MKIRLFVVALLGLMPALAPAAPETINYQSVPQLLAQGEIANVEIYDFGGKGVDAVLTRPDGSTLLIKRPIGLDEDAVLQAYLKEHNIPFLVYDRKYAGPAGEGKVGNSMTFVILPVLLTVGIPLLLILVILKQTRTTSRLAETIRTLSLKTPA